jgi:hypothetical protein
MSSYEWSNVKGELDIELEIKDGHVIDAHTGNLIPAIKPHMVKGSRRCVYELVIEFVSSGFYDEGRRHGDPGNCYPPEGHEDRELSRGYLLRYERLSPLVEIPLSQEKSQELFRQFEEQINEVELPSQEEDY